MAMSGRSSIGLLLSGVTWEELRTGSRRGHEDRYPAPFLNGDLRNDVALVTSFYFDPVNDYCLFVFLQDSNGGLLPPVRYPIGQEPASVDIGDLNDDGRADVLVGRKDNGFSVLYQDAAGG